MQNGWRSSVSWWLGAKASLLFSHKLTQEGGSDTDHATPLPCRGFRARSCPSLSSEVALCKCLHVPARQKPAAMVPRGDQDPQLHVEEWEDRLWTQGPVSLVVEIVHPRSASPSPFHRWKPHRHTWDFVVWDQACRSTQVDEGFAVELSRAPSLLF